MMDIITRATWGAQHGDGVGSAPLPASELWLHHSVTVAPDLVQPFDDDYAAIRTIERIGAERFGTSYGFPYTFGVTPVGLAFEGHHLRKLGAHTGGRNSVARAIVLVGNYENEEPTDEQMETVAWLVRHGYESGWWSTPVLSGGHRNAPGASTACPGQHAYDQIGHINHLAITGGGFVAPPRKSTPQEEDMAHFIYPSDSSWPIKGKAKPVFKVEAGVARWMQNPAVLKDNQAKQVELGQTAEQVRERESNNIYQYFGALVGPAPEGFDPKCPRVGTVPA